VHSGSNKYSWVKKMQVLIIEENDYWKRYRYFNINIYGKIHVFCHYIALRLLFQMPFKNTIYYHTITKCIYCI